MFSKLFLFLLLFAAFTEGCTVNSKKMKNMEKNGALRCAVLEEESKVWNTKAVFQFPDGNDADESLFVLKELVKRLDMPELKMARSSTVLVSVVTVFGSVEDSVLERICCTLRDIMEEYDTKPIHIVIKEMQDVKIAQTGQFEKQWVEVRGYIVE